MESMTGYGASRLEEKDLTIFSEIRSVNGKYLQVKWNLPSALNAYEKHLENVLRKKIRRGSVKVFIQYNHFQEEQVECFNLGLARQVLFTLDQLKRELGVSGELGFEVLARVPGLFEPPPRVQEMDEDVLFKIEQTFSDALEGFQEMRVQEGEILKGLLLEYVSGLDEKLQRIKARLPQAMSDYHQRLLERINVLIEKTGQSLSETDLARESAIIAERSDVTEEIDRLDAHILQFRKTCELSGAIGKKLDFIVQEFLREVNTLGNKLQDRDSSLLIPEMKLDIDKLKEQCQNIE